MGDTPMLKSCPFCGEGAVRLHSNHLAFVVRCTGCRAQADKERCEADADNAWNRRDPAAIVPDPANEAKLRELCLLLSAAVGKLVADHLQTVAISPRELVEQDLQLGNTPEFQDDFVSALELVTRDHLPPLIAIHNQAMTALAAMGKTK